MYIYIRHIFLNKVKSNQPCLQSGSISPSWHIGVNDKLLTR